MATAKKNLYLTSEVDLPSGEKPTRPTDPLPTRRVGPGILSELEISDAEIKTLPRGVVRPATADEIEGAESRATTAEARRVAADQEAERQAAEIERNNEKAQVAADLEREKADALSKIDAQHETERTKESAAAVTELNKVQGIAPAKPAPKK